MRRWYLTWADDPNDVKALYRVHFVRFDLKWDKMDIGRILPEYLKSDIVVQKKVYQGKHA